MKFSLIVACLVFMSGCTSQLRVSDNYTFDANSDEGLIVLSTRLADNCGANIKSAELRFRYLSSYEKIDGFFLYNPLMSKDFSNPPGYFNIKSLPAGEYLFSSIFLPGSSIVMSDIDHHHIYFTVEPNKIIYLGEFNLIYETCQRYRIQIKDKRERDKKLFDQRMKRLKSSEFEYQILGPEK